MNKYKWLVCALFSSALLGAVPSVAQAAKRDAQAEMTAAFEAARAVAKVGPTDIALKDQATLKLPEGFVFIPQPEADQVMKAMGNGNDPSRMGIVFPQAEEDWLVVIKYIDSGYIKDDEAKDWKSAEMLEQIKAGTEESNKERVDLGIPPMEIVGWVQSPQYDPQAHRLVWSIESKDKDVSSAGPNGINYNTYVLGREGYISMNLVTTTQAIEKDKDVATTLLADTSFMNGKAYADFNSSTDKIAEYGIGALVAGVAAKKLGLFALIAAFVAKFAKLFILGGIAVVAGLGKYFKREKKDPAPPAADGDGSTGSA